MKLSLRYLIICVWTFSLLVSTVGVRLYAVYCYCLNQTTYSLFDTDNQLVTAFTEGVECCSSHQEASPKSCCSSEPSVALPFASKINFSTPGCMNTSSKQLVLGVDLHEVSVFIKNFKVALPFPISIPIIPIYTICTSSLIIQDNKVPPDPPPPLSGRTICLLHEIARC